MISVRQNGQVYEISFKYDPEVINLVKNVPNRTWNPDAKVWTIPLDRLGHFLNQVKGTKYESQVSIISNENINVNASLDKTSMIPDIDISGVKLYVETGYTVYDHQKDFMRFAIHRQRSGYRSGFILADEPGLGKTLEVINFGMYNKARHRYRHCLVICCVNSGKYNWLEDIYKHTNGSEEGYILGTRLKRDKVTKRYNTGSVEKLEDLRSGHMYGDKNAPKLPYFLIVNIEAIRYKTGKTFPIAAEVIKMIKSGNISMIAIDEIHKNTSPQSNQGKQLLDIKKNCPIGVEWIPMTGTPITKKPTDVFLPLKLVDGHRYSSYYTWSRDFCIFGGFGGHEVMGYKNIPKLKSMLQGNMLRRLKSEVLDLPPKIYYVDYVENTPTQEKLYKQVECEVLSDKDSIVNSLNPLAKFMKLRQINGSPELVDRDIPVDSQYIKKNAKLAKIFELLEDYIDERGEKVVIFSNWVEPLRTLYRFVSKKYKTCCFTGTMKDEDREKHKRIFINNPEYKVLLGTIGAAGTTHTFTVANNVIFYDEPWNPSDKTQAEDRCHRVSSRVPINIHTIVTKDTIDERVHRILYTKEGISNYIVDNLDIRSNPHLFDLLLGHPSNK